MQTHSTNAQTLTEREERKKLSQNIIEKFGDGIDDLFHNER